MDGVALPALLRAGRRKGADAVHGCTATSTDPGSRSPIPIRKSMQTGQFQTPPAVRAPFVAPASATRGRFPSRLACGGWRRGPTSPARLRVLGNRSVNFTPDKNRHGARKSLGALTGPSRLDGALETLASRAETQSSPAPPTSRPTPRVPALAASLPVARAARRVPRAPIPVAFALAVLAVLAVAAPEQAAAQTETTFSATPGRQGPPAQTAFEPQRSPRAPAPTRCPASRYRLLLNLAAPPQWSRSTGTSGAVRAVRASWWPP